MHPVGFTIEIILRYTGLWTSNMLNVFYETVCLLPTKQSKAQFIPDTKIIDHDLLIYIFGNRKQMLLFFLHIGIHRDFVLLCSTGDPCGRCPAVPIWLSLLTEHMASACIEPPSDRVLSLGGSDVKRYSLRFQKKKPLFFSYCVKNKRICTVTVTRVEAFLMLVTWPRYPREWIGRMWPEIASTGCLAPLPNFGGAPRSDIGLKTGCSETFY